MEVLAVSTDPGQTNSASPARPCAPCPHLRGTLGSDPSCETWLSHTLSGPRFPHMKNRHNDLGNSPQSTCSMHIKQLRLRESEQALKALCQRIEGKKATARESDSNGLELSKIWELVTNLRPLFLSPPVSGIQPGLGLQLLPAKALSRGPAPKWGSGAASPKVQPSRKPSFPGCS